MATTKKKAKPRATAQPKDAVAMLKADHTKVSGLFEQFEKSRAASTKKKLVAQICMEYHREGGWTAERLADWLTARGFAVKVQSGGGWNGLLWARRGGLL